MNNAEQISALIKQRAKLQKIALKSMLSELGLGVNIISQFAQGREMSYLNLAKIADYLDCSVDYLLGRTDNPQAHIKATAVNYKLVNLLSQLTVDQQEMLEAQIKGLLDKKNNPPPKGDGQE